MDLKFLMNPEVMKMTALFWGEILLAGTASVAGFDAGLYTMAKVFPAKKVSPQQNHYSPTGLHLNIDIPPQSLQGLRADTFTRSQR